MKSDCNLKDEGTDASLHYFKNKTLHYLIKLNIIRFRQMLSGLECIVELTPAFKIEFNKHISDDRNNMVKLEEVLNKFAKENKLFLKKSLKYDMIKLMSFILGETSLKYYSKNTLKKLIDINVVEKNNLKKGSYCELQLTNQFILKRNEFKSDIKNKMSCFEKVIILINNNRIKLHKKVLYDMAKMVSFIDKFGENAKIWID